MKPTKLSRKPLWKWVLRNTAAIEFLRRILPYLIIKKAQAETLIAYSEKLNELKPKKYDNDTVDIRLFKEQVYAKLKELKKVA